MNDASRFHTNGVIEEYRNVDKVWVKMYLRMWTELKTYMKEFHTTGLAWSKMGL